MRKATLHAQKPNPNLTTQPHHPNSKEHAQLPPKQSFHVIHKTGTTAQTIHSTLAFRPLPARSCIPVILLVNDVNPLSMSLAISTSSLDLDYHHRGIFRFLPAARIYMDFSSM
ncbi:hypothetical protein BC936DRAFT_145809 [Jimgerdemannia flammicorona]|uniref:Uncharacterized protein n=1 Tax=Jimgerdemannia flammicorona TaxID=994334 RepID=A0A433D9S2_9FUNG|nr:hypothetical protein BC936DRAFT_145809 [Jimgerdemannia flammicorona]